MSDTSLMNAVQKLAGQAAQAVQADETAHQHAQLQKMQEQARQQNLMISRTNAYTLGSVTAGSTTYYQPQPTISGGAPGNWNVFPGLTGASVRPHSISFTAEQMSLFMEKLAHLLSNGWECVRCHRIWNPRETGCEFCNFIARLEGKDVDRDTASHDVEREAS